MTVSEAVRSAETYRKAKREAELRKAIQLVRNHPGDVRAAAIYLAVSRRAK